VSFSVSAGVVFRSLFSARMPGRVRDCAGAWPSRGPGCAVRARGHMVAVSRQAGRCAAAPARGSVQRTVSVARMALRGMPALAGGQWRREEGGGEMKRNACEVHGRRAAVAPSEFFTASGCLKDLKRIGP